MKVELRCGYCTSAELQETNIEGIFYCPTCDDEIHIIECDIEVLEVVEVAT